jgi:hypothetical protein
MDYFYAESRAGERSQYLDQKAIASIEGRGPGHQSENVRAKRVACPPGRSQGAVGRLAFRLSAAAGGGLRRSASPSIPEYPAERAISASRMRPKRPRVRPRAKRRTLRQVVAGGLNDA